MFAPLRRASALAIVLLCTGVAAPAVAASPTPSPAPSTEASGTAGTTDRDLVSFGISPAGVDRPDQRPVLSYAVAPGSTVEDQVAILNQDDQPIGLQVYSGDVVQADGGLSVRPHTETSTDAGAWIGVHGAGDVTVAAQTAEAGVGYTIVPFTITVPQTAEPGDHLGAIVASLTALGASGGEGTPAIQLDQRVAARVYVRVAGELAPGLVVTHLGTSYDQSVVGSGSMEVTYTLRNSGNMRMSVHPTVHAGGPFGLATRAKEGEQIDELLPGSSVTQTVTLGGVWPLLRDAVTVTAVAGAAPAGEDPGLEPVTATLGVWAVPWVPLALVALLALLFALWRRRSARRKPGRRVAPRGPRGGAGSTAAQPPAGPDAPAERRPLDTVRASRIHQPQPIFDRQPMLPDHRTPGRTRSQMRIKKIVSAVAAGSLLAAAAAVAAAGPASAADEGALLPGGIYWFNAVGTLDTLSAAQQINSGSRVPADATNPRPFATLALEKACPAGTVNIQASVRIPQVGVAENDWTQVPFTAQDGSKDAQGRWSIGGPDRLSKSEIFTYNATQAGSTGAFPLVVGCHDAANVPLGYFKTTLTVTGTDPSNYSWSIPKAAAPAGGFGGDSGSTQTATTTTLAAVASGHDLILTATVSPAAAGTVTFKESGASIGTAPVSGGTAALTITAPVPGVHSYSAEFAPTDAAAYGASSAAPQDFTVSTAPDGSIIVTLSVPAAPLGEPGALTLTVPANATVNLAGQRDTGNTRVTATAPLPTLTVGDTRRDDLLMGWEVNVQASDFTGTAGTIGAKYLGWAPGLPVMTKDPGAPLAVQAGPPVGSFLDDSASGGLGTSQLLAKSTTAGRGTTALDATLNLAVPGTTAEGSYTSTVTVTLVGG